MCSHMNKSKVHQQARNGLVSKKGIHMSKDHQHVIKNTHMQIEHTHITYKHCSSVTSNWAGVISALWNYFNFHVICNAIIFYEGDSLKHAFGQIMFAKAHLKRTLHKKITFLQ